jgi:hypothetical protein
MTVAPKKTMATLGKLTLAKKPLATAANGAAAPATAANGAAAEAEAEVPEAVVNATEFWKQACIWINAWAADGVVAASISERIPDTAENPLSRSILADVEGDFTKKNNIEMRLTKLQWWGRTIAAVPDGLRDLRLVAKQFVWDSFLKGPEQLALINLQVPDAMLAGNEQIVSGSVNATRFLDIPSKEPVYYCDGALCPPSVLQIIKASKTDSVIASKANQKVSAEVYGFMVPWENSVMFKTNEPKPEGKEPGSGAACAIVSNVKGHRMKLIVLGDILNRYTGSHYDLTEEVLTVGRKMTGAPNFCALMEIVMRWMDLRKSLYGNLRYFYRPLSAYYSNHRSKK